MIVTRSPTPPAVSSSLIEAHLREKSANTLEFVTFSNPNEARSKRVQQRVRRQAGRAGFKSAGTSKRRKPVSQTYELTAPALTALKHVASDSKQSTDGTEEVVQSLNTQRQAVLQYAVGNAVAPPMHLGVGFGLNPFQKYPMKMTQKHAMLTNFMKLHTASEPVFNVWISQALGDPTAWRMALATANMRLAILKSENPFKIPEDRESLQLYTDCLGQVYKRLEDPTDCISEGLIIAVLGFACQDIHWRQPDRWIIHMQGVRRMVDRRGGMKALDSSSNPWLRFTMHWVDMAGSLALNTPPFFTEPPDFSVDFDPPTATSDLLTSMVKSLKTMSNKFDDVSEGLLSAASLSTPMNNKIGRGVNRAKDGIAYLNLLLPVAHKIIALPVEIDISLKNSSLDEIDHLREIVRTGCRLYMSLMKWKLCAAPEGVMDLNEYMSSVLSCGNISWTTTLQPLRLWVLIVFAMSFTVEEVPYWVIAEISSSMEHSGLSEWDKVEETLQKIAWLPEPFKKALDLIGEQVERDLERGSNRESETNTGSSSSETLADDAPQTSQ